MRKIVGITQGNGGKILATIDDAGVQRTIPIMRQLTPLNGYQIVIYDAGGDDDHPGFCVDVVAPDGTLWPLAMTEAVHGEELVPGRDTVFQTHVWTNSAADDAKEHIFHRNIPGIPNPTSSTDEDGRLYNCPECGHAWVEFCDSDNYPEYCPCCGKQVSHKNGGDQVRIRPV